MKMSDPYDDVIAELDGDDALTVAQFRDALGSVTFEYPVEAIISPDSKPSTVGRGRGWYLAAAAVAAAIVTGAVVRNLGGPRENIALAEWTPTPQAVSDVERAEIEAACEVATPPSEADDSVPDLALDPSFDGALIDRRGDIAAVVATTADVVLECSAHFMNGEWYAFGTGVGWGGDSLQPSVTSGWNGDAEITMISGLAPNATSVEVDAPEFVSGTAPVINDRYVLWIPSSSDWGSDSTITVRAIGADGSVLTTVDLAVAAAPD